MTLESMKEIVVEGLAAKDLILMKGLLLSPQASWEVAKGWFGDGICFDDL